MAITRRTQPNNEELLDACNRVHWILGDVRKTEDVVAQAASNVAETSTQMRENRQRSDRNESEKPRASYRAYLDDHQIFDLLVMTVCESEEMDQEELGFRLSGRDRIKRFVERMVKIIIRRNSYYAGIGRCRILGDYTATEFESLYIVVAPTRAIPKDDAECSKTRDRFLKHLAKRFGVRPEELLNHDDSETLPPGDWRVSLIQEGLDRFLPSNSGFTIPTGYKWSRSGRPLLPYSEAKAHGDDAVEVDRMCLFLDTPQFNRLADTRQLDHCEKRMRKLRFFSSNEPGPDEDARDDGNPGPKFDLDRIRSFVAKEANRRRRIVPGSLSIRVDGIEHGIVDDSECSCAMLIEEDASVVEIVGKDEEGEIVLASYILTYDGPKTEVWKTTLPGSQKIVCTFEYDDNDCTRAELNLTRPMRPASGSRNSSEQWENARTDRLSLGWLKARIILDFVGKTLLSLAAVLATLLYTNKQQTLNAQQAAHELDLKYVQDFHEDIASEDPRRRSQAMDMFGVMSPRLAAQLVPIAARVDPITATSRSVEISGDRSEDPQTRSVAEQSRRQIMSDFRIVDPSYGANVELRQILRGTTPFRGMRHYIIVTTPQGVDFVTSEARVSGDSWEGLAILGEAGAGGNEKFSVRVISTKAALLEGPLVEEPADAMSSNSITVVRKP